METKKIYDNPKTRYDRLLISRKLNKLKTQRLFANRELLDPLTLKQDLDNKLHLFGEQFHQLERRKERRKSHEAAQPSKSISLSIAFYRESIRECL